MRPQFYFAGPHNFKEEDVFSLQICVFTKYRINNMSPGSEKNLFDFAYCDVGHTRGQNAFVIREFTLIITNSNT